MKKIFLPFFLLVVLLYLSHIQEKEEIYTKRSQDIAKIWHSASEMYGYWDLVGGTDEWDHDFPIYQERLWKCRDEYDYYILLEEMLAGLKDGHALIATGNHTYQWINELDIPGGEEVQNLYLGQLPFRLSFIEGKYLITKRTLNCPVPMYSEIIDINGLEVNRFLEENIAGRVGLQTDYARENVIGEKLCVSRYRDKIKLTFRTPDGTVKNIKMKYDRIHPPMNKWESAEPAIPGELLYEGKYLELYKMDVNCYVKIISLNLETVLEFQKNIVPLFPDTEGMILDLRFCGGGNTIYGTQILKMITGVPIGGMRQRESLKNSFEMRIAKQSEYGVEISGIDREGELVKRGQDMINSKYYYTMQAPENYSESIVKDITSKFQVQDAERDKSAPFEKASVILIGPNTMSAGESMAILAQNAGIPLVGNHTAGIEGDLVFERLSNGWLVGFSSGNSYGPNGEIIWNQGVKPDIEIVSTYSDIIEGRDEVLLSAMDYLLNSSNRISNKNR